MEQRPRRLVIGSGYLGLRIARLWAATGDRVWASTRGTRTSSLRQAGVEPVVVDVTVPCVARLPAVDTVLFAVGRDRAADASMRDIYEHGLARVLEALPASVRQLIYISTTGVYGQDDGTWVDESSPCEPSREGGRACLAAEALLRDSGHIPQRTVLRMAGLYGPGRVPHSAAILSGAPVPGAADAFLNLVHVDDAARAVVAAAALPECDGVDCYLVSDGVPLTRGTYVERVARYVGAAVPAFAGGSGLGKRVCNARMRTRLGVALEYASIEEGLASVPRHTIGAP